MVLLKTILIWVLEWLAKKLAVLIAAWMRRKEAKKRDEKSSKDIRDAQEKAETPEEREDAAEKTIDGA